MELFSETFHFNFDTETNLVWMIMIDLILLIVHIVIVVYSSFLIVYIYSSDYIDDFEGDSQ